ncbi:MAG: glycosyltransferase family 4 protein [Acidobacteria bacterium]|nr:glycosyltransferase family 4 protein [Acidobacteriota bacterium]
MSRRVGINLMWVLPGRVGGSEDYAVRTCSALASHCSSWSPVIFASPELIEAHSESLGGLEVVARSLPTDARIVRIAAENTWLRSAARRVDVEVLHHVGGRMPAIGAGIPTVLTLHDLQPLDLTQNFSAIKRHYLRRAIPRSLSRADSVIAVSVHVADQIRERFDLPAVEVVSAPFDNAQLSPAPQQPPEVVAMRGAPFVLYPAVTHPHKNHATLLAAIGLLLDRDIAVNLVSTGGQGSAEVEFHAAVEELGLGDRVVRLGRVERPVLDRLLIDAAALVFPSTYEGFGIPLLEAMAAHCPIIAADTSAIPSVVGDAAILVPPDDPKAWADAIGSIVSGTLDATHIVARGRERVEAYTAQQTADRLANAYDRAVGITRGGR